VKRTAAALFTAVLLLSALAVTQLTNLAAANPVGLYFEFPTEPIRTMPAIVVHSPVQNQNYNSSELWLNFTIIKPEAWIKLPEEYGGSDGQGNPLYVIFGNITSVYYVIDGGEPQNIPVHDLSYVAETFPKRTLNFSTSLTLTRGTHNVVVGLKADSYYEVTNVYTAENATDAIPAGSTFPMAAISSVVVNGSSEMIRFAVGEPEPFQTIVVVAASVATVAVLGAGLLVYFKKRRAKSGDQA
jgi:hypothetical protein